MYSGILQQVALQRSMCIITVGCQVNQILKTGGQGPTLTCTLELSSQPAMPLEGEWNGTVNIFVIPVWILHLKCTKPMSLLYQPTFGLVH